MERWRGSAESDKIVGGVIPRQFIPSVEWCKAMEDGYLAGYPGRFRATVYDGKYHPSTPDIFSVREARAQSAMDQLIPTCWNLS